MGLRVLRGRDPIEDVPVHDGVQDAVPVATHPGRNEVVLVGRLTRPATSRSLPSGDVLVTFGVTVARPPDRPGGRTVDALDCVAWEPGVQRAALSWVVDDVVEVRGSLRRRFWRSSAGAASKCEVEVTDVRLVPADPDQSSP